MKKTALITGASSGIGLEFAKIFAENNNNLVLIARNETKLNELAKELSKTHNIEVTVLGKDLSKIETPKEVFDYCNSHNIKVNYLINNAGVGDYGKFSESEWPKQLNQINLNITALVYLTHLFLPKMIEAKDGKILNIASTAAFQPGPLMSVYYATKAFVLHFSEAIANELKRTGVTVTTICPGPTQSSFFETAQMEDSNLVKSGNLSTAKALAEFGYKSMMKSKVVDIHGMINYIMANSVRFMPRNAVLAVVRIVMNKGRK